MQTRNTMGCKLYECCHGTIIYREVLEAADVVVMRVCDASYDIFTQHVMK